MLTQEQILEGNQLIAQFMDAKIHTGNTIRTIGITYATFPEELEQFEGPTYATSILQYYSDWNWLMPVVEKIEAMGHPVIMEKDICSIGEKDSTMYLLFNIYGKDKLTSTYIAVVEFIKWWNQNKQ